VTCSTVCRSAQPAVTLVRLEHVDHPVALVRIPRSGRVAARRAGRDVAAEQAAVAAAPGRSSR
jgi:hypothetical protein